MPVKVPNRNQKRPDNLFRVIKQPQDRGCFSFIVIVLCIMVVMEKKPLKLIVGLGNPGKEYEYTRHNAGFWFMAQVLEWFNTEAVLDKKFSGLVARTGTNPLFLLMPQTYMNKSGVSVSALARFYKIEPEEILVVHDELDLPVGTARFKFGGGNGGHNGLKDIDAHLGTRDYWRLRIGIDHPGNKDQVIGYVLARPSLEDFKRIVGAFEPVFDHMRALIDGDFEAVMRNIHGKTA